MEHIVAVAVSLKEGGTVYFLTWGRIQSPVDPCPLEKLVLSQSKRFALGGKALEARVCGSLQEARREPFFYEYFFSMSQKLIPFGVSTYKQWRREMDEKKREGKELYFLGSSGPRSREECSTLSG